MNRSHFDRLPARFDASIDASYRPVSLRRVFASFVGGCILIAAAIIAICLLWGGF